MTSAFAFQPNITPLLHLKNEEEMFHNSKNSSLLDKINAGQYFTVFNYTSGVKYGLEVIKQDGKLDYLLFNEFNYLINDTVAEFDQYIRNRVMPAITKQTAGIKNLHKYFYGIWAIYNNQHKWLITDIFNQFTDYGNDIVKNEVLAVPDRNIVADELKLEQPTVLFDGNKEEWLKSIDSFKPKTTIIVETAGIKATTTVEELTKTL